MQHERYLKWLLWSCLGGLFFCSSGLSRASAVLPEVTRPSIITATTTAANLAMSLAYYEDIDQVMTADDMYRLPKERWHPYSDLDFRAGNSRSAYWMTFSFQGDTTLARNSEFMLEFNVAFLSMLDIYLLRDNTVHTYLTGVERPLSQRPYPIEIPVIPLLLGPQEKATVLVRVANEGPILLPTTLYPKQQFHLSRANRNLMLGAFLSLCIVLGSYNLFLYFSIRDNSYLLYTLSIFLLGWLQASVQGFTAHYLWQDHFREMADSEPSLILWGWYAAQLLFTRKFLELSVNFKRLDRLFIGLTVFCCVMMVASCFPPLYWCWEVYGIASPLLVVIIMATGIYAYRRGLRSARFFLIGGSFLLLGGMCTSLYYMGVLPASVLAKNGVVIGSAIEGILYSLALADRINGIQRENLQAQKQARLALEASNKEKDEFLIAVSHELRTPLNAIMGAIELSKKEMQIDKLKENNEITALGWQRMQDSVDNLLYLSTLNANKLTPVTKPLSVHELVNGLIGDIKDACADKQLRFNTAIELPEHRRLVGDADIMRMLLKQLLKNAVMFTHQGSVSLTLSETTSEDGSHALTAIIEDTGDGIAPERLSTLFDAFRQGSSGYNRTHEGLGVGLNICKRLIQLVQGDMQIQSAPGQGTRITLQIPLMRSQLDADTRAHLLTATST